MKKFTNKSDQPFEAKWAGETTLLNPGDAITVEDNIAAKFAKDLAYMQLFAQRREAEKEAIDKGEKVKVLAVGARELAGMMENFIEDKSPDSNIERAEEKPKKKSKKKTAEDEKPSDDDFE
jgi:hypothetical protein